MFLDVRATDQRFVPFTICWQSEFQSPPPFYNHRHYFHKLHAGRVHYLVDALEHVQPSTLQTDQVTRCPTFLKLFL